MKHLFLAIGAPIIVAMLLGAGGFVFNGISEAKAGVHELEKYKATSEEVQKEILRRLDGIEKKLDKALEAR